MRKRSNGIAVVAACLALAVALSSGAAGCGGSGSGGRSTDGGASGGSGGTPGNGTISWQDDGVAHQTAFATASLVTSSGIQLLQVAGGEAGGIGIAFGVTGKPTVELGAFLACASQVE